MLQIHAKLETYINDFKTLPFAIVYSLNETNNRTNNWTNNTLNKLILLVIDKHAAVVKTKFTRPPAPLIEDIKINKLQCKQDHWPHKPHKNLRVYARQYQPKIANFGSFNGYPALSVYQYHSISLLNSSSPMTSKASSLFHQCQANNYQSNF